MIKKRINFQVYLILTGILLGISIMGFCTSCNTPSTPDFPFNAQYTSPVSILSNADLTSFLLGQSGPGDSWETAYIIEDLQIDSLGSGPGLRIENTNLFLIVTNIFVTDSGSSSYSGAIQLTNTTKISIQNTETTAFGNGIFVIESTYIEILDNIAKNNVEDGIHLLDSSNCAIMSNDASSNPWYGITIKNSHSNTISNNVANDNTHYGVYLENSKWNQIEKNTIKNNFLSGIYLIDSDQNTITHNTLIGNGEPITEISCENNVIIRNKTNFLMEIILGSAAGIVFLSLGALIIIRNKRRG